MSSIDDEIRAKTETFAHDLDVLVRRIALEAVAVALGGSGATAAMPVQVAAQRGRGRPRKVAPAVPAATAPVAATPVDAAPVSKAPVSKKAAPKRAPGAKRPPGELATLTEKLGEFIKANAGAQMAVIAKALGSSARELRFPARKLIAAKRIRTEGQKQNTAYFPA